VVPSLQGRKLNQSEYVKKGYVSRYSTGMQGGRLRWIRKDHIKVPHGTTVFLNQSTLNVSHFELTLAL
jgi:hypothetical protein